MRQIQNTSDGGYVFVTQTSVYKLDPQGNIQWNRQVSYTAYLNTVLQDSDLGYVLGANYQNPGVVGTPVIPLVIKLDTNGNILWQTLYGNAPAAVQGVVPAVGGGYILAGAISVNNDWGNSRDYWFLKINSQGNTLWQQVYNLTTIDQVSSVAPTTDGGFVVGGSNWLAKLDANGNVQWQEALPHVPYSIQQTSDGGYIVGTGPGSASAALLYKLDSNGAVSACPSMTPTNATPVSAGTAAAAAGYTVATFASSPIVTGAIPKKGSDVATATCQ